MRPAFAAIWARSALLTTFLISCSWTSEGAKAQPCSLPLGGTVKVPPLTPRPYWSMQELWVWSQLIIGASADFNKLYCMTLNPTKPNDEWANRKRPRNLSAQFLIDLLFHSDLVASLPPWGLQIVGARFSEPIYLPSLRFDRPLRMLDSRFDSHLIMSDSEIQASLSLRGSTLSGDFNISQSNISGSLDLRDTLHAGQINVNETRIIGNLLVKIST